MRRRLAALTIVAGLLVPSLCRAAPNTNHGRPSGPPPAATTQRTVTPPVQTRTAPTQARAMPTQARTTPAQTRTVTPTRPGFALNRDIAPVLPATQVRVTQPVARQPTPQYVEQSRQRNANVQVSIRLNPTHRFAGNPGARRTIGNPAFHGGAWGWNHGVAWDPAPVYWGGGFWGALALSATAALFGAIDDDNQQYYSYAVYPDSPGATLLENYQLTQTPCGPPGLVVLWGPDNSVICAYPNDTVAAGDYDIDPDTLTIVSE